MRCAELDELISAYVDRQTGPAQTEFLEAHLQDCRRCQHLLRREQETRHLLAALATDEWAPPDLRLRITHAYRQQKVGRRKQVFLGGVAAMLAAILAIINMSGNHLAPSPLAIAQPTIAVAVASPTPPQVPCRGCAVWRLARQLGVPRSQIPSLLAETLDIQTPARASRQHTPGDLANVPLSSVTKGGDAGSSQSGHYHGLVPL